MSEKQTVMEEDGTGGRDYSLLLLFLLLLNVPYLYALFSAGEDSVFSGFLVFASDGASYLAKMHQGYLGHWLYHDPFTYREHKGVHVFTLYVLLGHVARWASLPLLLIFHLARNVASVLLFFALRSYLRSIFVKHSSRRYTLALACFGLGSGWAAAAFGRMSPDLWLVEAYPFLSAFTTVHFPLSLALMLSCLVLLRSSRRSAPLLLFLCAGILCEQSPFAYVILMAVSFCQILAAGNRVRGALSGLALLIGGMPVLIYQRHVMSADPVLQAWQAQNITPSPPVLDLIIALAPLVFFAVYGLWTVVRMKRMELVPAAAWLCACLISGYLPLDLQRRLFVGCYIPLAVLAAAGLEELSRYLRTSAIRFVRAAVLSLSVLTTAFFIVQILAQTRAQDSALYLSREASIAFEWLRTNSSQQDVILSDCSTGKYIAGHAGRRVVCGHWCETPDYKKEKERFAEFLSHAMPEDAVRQYLETRNVSFVYLGEAQELPPNVKAIRVFGAGQINIYAVGSKTSQ